MDSWLCLLLVRVGDWSGIRNPIAFETQRLKKKIDVGAEFVITQPVIGKDPNVDLLNGFDVTPIIEAWMSQNADLLYKSVWKQKDSHAEEYDPLKNQKFFTTPIQKTAFICRC